MDYLEIIKQKAFRPIKRAGIILPNFIFDVEFENGDKVYKKCEVGLREFLCTVQHLKYKTISGNTEHCILSPVGYWALFGFRSGDAIEFRDDGDRFLSILFS